MVVGSYTFHFKCPPPPFLLLLQYNCFDSFAIERTLYQRVRKYSTRKANGVHLSSRFRASVKEARRTEQSDLFIGALMLGACLSSYFHGSQDSQRRCEPFGALPILLGIFRLLLYYSRFISLCDHVIMLFFLPFFKTSFFFFLQI